MSFHFGFGFGLGLKVIGRRRRGVIPQAAVPCGSVPRGHGAGAPARAGGAVRAAGGALRLAGAAVAAMGAPPEQMGASPICRSAPPVRGSAAPAADGGSPAPRSAPPAASTAAPASGNAAPAANGGGVPANGGAAFTEKTGLFTVNRPPTGRKSGSGDCGEAAGEKRRRMGGGSEDCPEQSTDPAPGVSQMGLAGFPPVQARASAAVTSSGSVVPNRTQIRASVETSGTTVPCSIFRIV